LYLYFVLSVFYILTHILKRSTLHLCTGSRGFRNISYLRMAPIVAEIFRTHTMYIA